MREVALAAAGLAVAVLAAAPQAASGQQVTPPSILSRASPDAMKRCYATEHPEADLAFMVMLDEQGKPTGVEFGPGAEPWMKQVASCVVLNMRFAPGKIDGRPVASQARLPLQLRHTTSTARAAKLSRPEIKTPPAERDAIARGCYPAGREDSATVHLKITVTESGALRKSVVVASSGDADLDAAAQCMVAAYRFTPGTRGSGPVEMNADWTVELHPPKR